MRKRSSTKRFGVMGIMDSAIARRGVLVLLIFSLVEGWVSAQVSPRRIRVELRWAEASPGKGLAEARVRKTRESIYLHREAVIRNEDIIKAQALEDPNTIEGYKVALVFTKQAAERMVRSVRRGQT